jgi:GNAT superfamily N-acetyltransferase/uncharacterized glyoxalase superfamily protein PhnB
MIFKHSVPILYSSDIRKSIQYYKEVLGFDQDWEWDDVPTFGGVSKDNVSIFFCKESQGNPGTWVSIFIDNVDELYERVKVKGGKIAAPPEDKPWNLREMLVQDPDGHIIRFGQNKTHGDKKSGGLPSNIEIIERMPTVEEYAFLVKSVGWKEQSKERVTELLKAPVYAVVAEDANTSAIAGCVLLLGDNASFYYVKDMMVHADYQRKHVGTALMQKLNDWIEKNAAPDALVGLYTGDSLAPFYKNFGFGEYFGMGKRTATKSE